MNISKSSPRAGACLLLSTLSGCVVAGAPSERGESTRTTASALSQAVWHPERVSATGVGCRFADDASGAADAYAIAAGADVSLVFTRLGEATRHGRKNQKVLSECNFVLPISVPQDTALTSWTQTLWYGVVKPAGVAAGLGARSRFVGKRGMNLPLPLIEQVFDTVTSANIASDALYAGTETFDQTHGRYAAWRSRWCKRDAEEVNLELQGTAFTWVQNASQVQEVVLAIDGLDMRVDLSSTFEVCAK